MADEDSGASTLAKQSGITFVGQVVGKALKFGFVLVVTHLVSPTTFGLYTLGLSTVSFLRPLANFNIQTSVDYFVPKYLDAGEPGRARGFIHQAVALTLLSSAVMAALLFVGAGHVSALFNDPNLTSVIAGFAFALPFMALNSVVKKFFTSIKQMQFRVYVENLVFPVTKLAVAVALVLLGFEVLALVAGFLFAVATASFVGILLALKYVPWLSGAAPQSVPSRTILSYSLPLAFAGVAYATVGQIDFFVLGYFMQSADVGIYRVGFLLASNVVIVQASLTPVFKPMIVEVRDDPSAFQSRYILGTRWLTMLTAPAAAVLAIAPGVYLGILFAAEYGAAATALAVLAVGQFLNIAVGPTGRVLQATGRTRVVLLNTVLLVGLNAALDILLVPRLGLLGAAVGTALALTLVGLVAVAELRYLFDVHPFSLAVGKLWIAMIPAIVAAASVRLVISETLLVAVSLPLVLGATYFAGLRLLDGFTDADVEVAAKLDERLGRAVFTRLVGNGESSSLISDSR